jgi:Flp pilus assembly protein TadB
MTKVFIFIELVFGFFLFVRISNEFRTKNIINETVMTKFFIGYLLWQFVWAFLLSAQIFYFSILIWAPVLTICFLPIYLSQKRKKQFRSELPLFINHIILKLRSGAAFRTALQVAGQNLTQNSKIKVDKMVEMLNLPSDEIKNNFLDDQAKDLLTFFRKTEQEIHLTLPRLIQLRSKLKVEDSFHSKMLRATGQLKAQAFILSSLYGCLFIAVIYRFGWANHKNIISLSLVLFAIGVFAILQQGRGYKWKV